MAGFILVDDEYSNVPSLLIEQVQGFADSLEYDRLSDEDRELPGLVAAAFTQFFERFQTEDLAEDLNHRDSVTLIDCYRAVEELASKNDTRIRELVKFEIFENLRVGGRVRQLIEDRLGPASSAVLQEWRRGESG